MKLLLERVLAKREILKAQGVSLVATCPINSGVQTNANRRDLSTN
jgi:hypothetical protein